MSSAPAKSRFGIWTLTLLVVANMVGAGVFTTSGFSLRDLGTPERVLVAWVIGGLVATAGAISYGYLIRAMPESGGEYLFLSRAIHPLAGYVAGWISLIAGFSGAISLAATTLETYIVPGDTRPEWLPEDALAVTVIVVCGLFHAFRPMVGAAFQNTTVILKIGLLIAFIGYAMYRLPHVGWSGGPLPDKPTGVWPVVAAMAGSLVWISLSYSGFNAAVYVAEEAKEAINVIPRALIRGTLIVSVLYLVLNAIFVFGPPSDRVIDEKNISAVAAVAADWIGGRQLSNLVRAIIAVALVTSVSSMMMAAPRVYAKMAEDRLMPGVFLTSGSPGCLQGSEILLQ